MNNFQRELLKYDIETGHIIIHSGCVSLADYCDAKTKDLNASGYSTVSAEQIKEELIKLSANSDNISVIGRFVEDDLNYNNFVQD